LPLVAELVRRAGSGIIVMPRGGITARNVERIVEAAKPKEIHFGALDSVPSAMSFVGHTCSWAASCDRPNMIAS
jgi:copper homeostasis protein